MHQQAATTPDIRRDLVGILPKLRRFALTLTGNLVDADELVQTVCQRGIAKSRSWNGEVALEAWLYTMSRQQWADDNRRHRIRPSASKNPGLAASAENVVQINSPNAGEARGIVTSLPEGCASAFLLVDIERFGYKQAADILGISLEALGQRLSRARIELAAKGHSRSSQRF